MKEGQSTDSNQWPGLILSSSTTGLPTEGTTYNLWGAEVRSTTLNPSSVNLHSYLHSTRPRRWRRLCLTSQAVERWRPQPSLDPPPSHHNGRLNYSLKTTTTTILWPLCRTIWLSWNPQLRTEALLLPACPCWWQIVHRIREKMLEFSSAVLPAQSPYLLLTQVLN